MIFFRLVNVYFLSYHFIFQIKTVEMTDMKIFYNYLSQKDKKYFKVFLQMSHLDPYLCAKININLCIQ